MQTRTRAPYLEMLKEPASFPKYVDLRFHLSLPHQPLPSIQKYYLSIIISRLFGVLYPWRKFTRSLAW